MSYVLTSHWPGTSVILPWNFFFYSPHILIAILTLKVTFFSLIRDSSPLAYQLVGYRVDLTTLGIMIPGTVSHTASGLSGALRFRFNGSTAFYL